MVEQTTFPVQELLAGADARQTISDKQIRRAVELIKAKYGFVPSDLYVRDLITFLQELVRSDGQRS